MGRRPVSRVRFIVRAYEDVRAPFDLAVLALLALGVRPHEVPERIPPHLHLRSSYQGGAKRVRQRTWETETKLEELGLIGSHREQYRPTRDGRELLALAIPAMELRDQATLAPPLRARAARFALVVRAADAAMRRAGEGAPSVAPYGCTCAGCTALRIGYAIGIESRGADVRPVTTDPCRPGAWGSMTNCAVHEGYDLDETGRCIEGRAIDARACPIDRTRPA